MQKVVGLGRSWQGEQRVKRVEAQRTWPVWKMSRSLLAGRWMRSIGHEMGGYGVRPGRGLCNVETKIFRNSPVKHLKWSREIFFLHSFI